MQRGMFALNGRVRETPAGRATKEIVRTKTQATLLLITTHLNGIGPLEEEKAHKSEHDADDFREYHEALNDAIWTCNLQ